jgi:hypothetical protein
MTHYVKLEIAVEKAATTSTNKSDFMLSMDDKRIEIPLDGVYSAARLTAILADIALVQAQFDMLPSISKQEIENHVSAHIWPRQSGSFEQIVIECMHYAYSNGVSEQCAVLNIKKKYQAIAARFGG